MPFDPAPITPAKVNTFQEFAEAMLRGCKMSRALQGDMIQTGLLGIFKPKACALGALNLGLGIDPENMDHPATRGVRAAYFRRYQNGIMFDNDSGRFTREQIAARIAAL